MFYRGLGVKLAYVVPAAGVNFTSALSGGDIDCDSALEHSLAVYEQVKKSAKAKDASSQLPVSLITGGLIRMVGVPNIYLYRIVSPGSISSIRDQSPWHSVLASR